MSGALHSQMVVFEDLRGLTACLECIAADQEARVVRVKNRYDPAYDTDQTAGYR